jgi:hypothetical protein
VPTTAITTRDHDGHQLPRLRPDLAPEVVDLCLEPLEAELETAWQPSSEEVLRP